MIQRYFTPEEYVLSCIAKYPSMYGSPTLESSRFRVLDQLLNVIGNGITCNEDLARELTYVPFDELDAKRWITHKSAAYGYDEVDQYGWGVPPCKVATIEDEKYKYPDIKFWVAYTPGVGRIPYQNFTIGHSAVYTTDFCKYGEAWINAAIWYYRKCRDFFADGCWLGYQGAYPGATPQLTEQLLCQYAIALRAYGSWKEISDISGVQYTGDNQRFAQDVWERELGRIRGFITTTLEHLVDAKKVIAQAELPCLVDSPLVEGGAPASVVSAPEQTETKQPVPDNNMITKKNPLQILRDIIAGGEKLTNVAFAEATGLSDYGIQQILTGKRELTGKEIPSVMGQLNVCARWLATGYAYGIPVTMSGAPFTRQTFLAHKGSLPQACQATAKDREAGLEELAWVPTPVAKLLKSVTVGLTRGATQAHLDRLVDSANFIFDELPESKVTAVHAPSPVKTTMRISTDVFRKDIRNAKDEKVKVAKKVCTTLP